MALKDKNYYFETHAPVRDQWRTPRREEPRFIVLHTPEGDYLQGLLNFIRTRTSPGSYHVIPHPVGIQWCINPINSESYGARYGYNQGGVHVSLLGHARHYAGGAWKNDPEKVATVSNAIQACIELCDELNIEPIFRTKAEIDIGKSGITTHGMLDPERRSDPGMSVEDLSWFCGEVRKGLESMNDESKITPVGEIGPQPVLADTGYYLWSTGGGVYALADAPFFGAPASLNLNAPIVGMAAVSEGYYMLGEDGGIFAYGPGAVYLGNPIEKLKSTGRIAVGIMAFSGGYYVLDSYGELHPFGHGVRSRGDFVQGVLI